VEELTLWQVARLVTQAHALNYVAESLLGWRSWPDTSLSDQLESCAAHIVAAARDALHRSGLAVDQGETGTLDDADEPGG
jgi:hypothetical protein